MTSIITYNFRAFLIRIIKSVCRVVPTLHVYVPLILYPIDSIPLDMLNATQSAPSLAPQLLCPRSCFPSSGRKSRFPVLRILVHTWSRLYSRA